MKDIKQRFKEIISLLNERQKEAVHIIEGPVMVLAGPGTGKTQIIAARIGHILQQSQSNPENILCLTYTEAGTVAMRKRLLSFIGPAAYRVQIHTFHSFCNKVIQENNEAFGFKELDAINDLEKIQLYHHLIDHFEDDNPLKRWRGDIYYEQSRLEKLFDIMKRENWSKSFIQKAIQTYIEDLPNRKKFIYQVNRKPHKKGDLKQKEYEQACQKMSLLQAAADQYKVFNQLMYDLGKYDFNDMINKVLYAFKTNDSLLARYQEQLQYILVDEYQDTNGAQNALLYKLVDFWDNPNLFVVGDDDQAIFRFQGANIQNIEHFISKYRPNLIVLENNYRSTQSILNFAKTLIEYNKERLVNHHTSISKNLLASNPSRQEETSVPRIIAYYNETHQIIDIAKKIETLCNQKVPLNEIAVIYRSHKEATDISRYLTHKNIPIQIRRKINILDQKLIQNICNIIEYIADENKAPHSREDLLFRILHYDMFGISPIAISRLAFKIQLQRKENTPLSWREAIHYAERHLDLRSDIEAIKICSTHVESWIKAQHNYTLQGLIEHIIYKSSLLKYIYEHKDKIWLLQELSTFFEFVKVQSKANPQINIYELNDAIQTMKQYGVDLPLQQTSFIKEAVHFITAHASKGLEFEHVFIIGASQNNWDKPKRNKQYTYPDTLISSSNVLEDEEQRRLFYVAITRAKKALQISFAQKDNDGKEQVSSKFVAEITSSSKTEISEIALQDDMLTNYQMVYFSPSQKTHTPLIENNYVDTLLDKYTMSITHLNSYIRCPISFYYDKVLRIPISKNKFMAFGTAIHFALEKLFIDINKKISTHPLAEIIKYFEWSMYKQRYAFTQKEYTQQIHYGKKILREYIQNYSANWHTSAKLEFHISTTHKGIPINGVLDKIEMRDKKVRIIDYKTGQFLKNKNKFARPKAAANGSTSLGEDYWRQAVFYTLLLNEYPYTNWNVEHVEFDFVEPDIKTGLFHKKNVPVSAEDIRIVSEQIQNTYRDIKALKFNKGCQEDNCYWCQFTLQLKSE